MTVEPCHCPEPNPRCLRSGRPMARPLWEICSGNCPALLAKNPKASDQVRAEWDRRAAAIAAGKDPFPHRRQGRGLGDWTKWLIAQLPFAKKLSGCGGCAKRQQSLNRFGRWLKRILAD
jgi:hypothetical protein